MATVRAWTLRAVALGTFSAACTGNAATDEIATGSPAEPEPAQNGRQLPDTGTQDGSGVNAPPPNETVPFSAPDFIFADLLAPSAAAAVPPSAPYTLALTQLYVYWLRMDGTIERSLKTALDIEQVAALPVPPDSQPALDDSGPFWGALAVLGDRSAVVTELGAIHFAPFDGSDVATLQVLSGVDASGWPLELGGLDSAENEALLTGPSCDPIFRLSGEGTLAPLVERESTGRLRSNVSGTAERFWCAGTTLSRYEGTPPTSVLDIDVVATSFCEMGEAIIGIANEAPSWMFRTDARLEGDVVELPGTEGAARLACASDELTYWAKPDDEGTLHVMALNAEGRSTEFHQLPLARLGAWVADPQALYWLEDGKLVRWPRSALPN